MPPIRNDRTGRRTVRAGHIIAAAGVLFALAAAGLLIAAFAFRTH